MSETNGQSLLGKPRTRRYLPYQHFMADRPRDLPPFGFDTIRAMLLDPAVRLGLAMRAAPISGVEFAYKQGEEWVPGIRAKDPQVGAFVWRQLKRFWSHGLDKLLKSQVWGWSAGEVTYRLSSAGTVEVDCLLDRHAADTRALERDGELCGVRFLRIGQGNGGVADLPMPKAWFHAYRPEAGFRYGVSVLKGAYSPFADKWFHGGALDVRRLFMHKDAYGGTDLTYPDGVTRIGDEDVPNRDIAAQIMEQLVAGGATTRPSQFDQHGNEKWSLTRATVPANPAHILQYPKDLDTEIYHGLEIPDDVIESATGAWAGKRIPMAAFYAGLDGWIRSLLLDLREQIIERLAVLNFGQAEFEIDFKPLAEQALEQQAAAGGPQGQGEQPSQGGGLLGGFPGLGAAGQDSGPPQRMGLDVVRAVGDGVLSATGIVEAARLALGFSTQRMLWDEDEHPRADDGTFTAGSGASQKKTGSSTGEHEKPNVKDAREAHGKGARRSRNTVRFEKPITGPSGASLLSYDWQWMWEESPDYDDPRRVSDWSESVENEQTGKHVVHQFSVADAKGKHHVVSLESALKLLGFDDGAAGAGKVKNLAAASMDLVAAQREHEALEGKPADERGYSHDYTVRRSKERVEALEKRVANLTKEAERAAAGGKKPADHYRDTMREALRLRKLFHSSEHGEYNDNRVQEIARKSAASISERPEIEAEGRAAYRALMRATRHNVLGERQTKTPVPDEIPATKAWGHDIKPVPAWSDAKLRNWWFEHGEDAEAAIEQARTWLEKHHPQAKRMAADAGGTWVTIGGRKEGEKQHAGGFPVKLDADGNIVAGGPKGLKGKHISKVRDYFRRSRNTPQARKAREAASNRRNAKDWGMTEAEYTQFADDVWKEKVANHAAREKAKAYARQRLNVTAADVNRLENQGFDYSSGKIKGLDTFGRELASQFPDLGWGEGYVSEGEQDPFEYDAALWDLLREGKRELPARGGPEFHEAVAEYLNYLNETYGRSQTERRAEPDEAADYVPFGLDGLEQHEYSSTQFDLPPEIAEKVHAMAGRIHPDDLAADGVEHQPHLTVKYGLHTDDPDEVRRAVLGQPPVAVTFDKVSVFQSAEHDVLKVDVDSKALHALNAHIAASLACTDTFPEYVPHVTVAYVKPGLGDWLANQMTDLVGHAHVFNRLTFSDKRRRHVTLPLTGKATRFGIADTEADDDPLERAQWIAGLFARVYGDRAEEMLAELLGDEDEQPTTMAAGKWDASLHPRDKSGRFVVRGTPEAYAAAKAAIDKSLGDKRSAESAGALASHAQLLTVKQLHELGREYQLQRGGGIREDLIRRLARRLDRGRRRPPADKPAAAHPHDEHFAELVRQIKQHAPDVDADKLARSIGMDARRGRIEYQLGQLWPTSPPATTGDPEADYKAKEAYRQSRRQAIEGATAAIGQGMGEYWESKGIATPPDYSAKGPRPAEEREAERQAKAAEVHKSDLEFARQNFKKPPPRHTMRWNRWAAVLAEQRKQALITDRDKVQKLIDLQNEVDLYDEAVRAGTGRTREELRDAVARYDKLYSRTKSVLKRYVNEWEKPAKGFTPRADDVRERIREELRRLTADTADQSLGTNWRYSRRHGAEYADWESDVRDKVTSGEFSLPEDMLAELRYEDWLPKGVKEKIAGQEAVKGHADYVEGQHPFWRSHVTQALEHAKPELDRLLADVGEDAKRLANREERGKRPRNGWKSPRDTLWQDQHVWLSRMLPKGGNESAIIPKPAGPDAGHPAEFREELQRANDFLRRAIGPAHGKLTIGLAIDGRRRACADGTTVRGGWEMPDTTLVHEVGHVLESQQGTDLAYMSRAYAMERVAQSGDKVAQYGHNYDGWEVGAKDGFVDEYVGKFYHHAASEVLSMGLQLMYDNPVKFYFDDPDHFRYTLAALHGWITPRRE